MHNDKVTCFQEAKCLIRILTKPKTFGKGKSNKNLELKILNSQHKLGRVS